uniref:Uncharacterized protein n=1 Tax=viral metagenome TaxID=1070528 RepID=A0A6C0JEN8_9ZZZZ
MVLFYLTNLTLDVITGAAWWTATKTYNGAYYLLYGSSENNKDTIEVNKETIEKLVKENENYQEQIKNLSDNVNTLSNYIKNKQ